MSLKGSLVSRWNRMSRLARWIGVALMIVTLCATVGIGINVRKLHQLQQQTQSQQQRIDEENTPAGRQAAQKRVDDMIRADRDAINIDIAHSDPDWLVEHLPCRDWPSSVADICAEHRGDMSPAPTGQPTPTPTESPADTACAHLSKADAISCYARFSGN